MIPAADRARPPGAFPTSVPLALLAASPSSPSSAQPDVVVIGGAMAALIAVVGGLVASQNSGDKTGDSRCNRK
jgi:hypothetical protein